jgi:hypothetical protein
MIHIHKAIRKVETFPSRTRKTVGDIRDVSEARLAFEHSLLQDEFIETGSKTNLAYENNDTQNEQTTFEGTNIEIRV